MATFEYKARTKEGEARTGVIDASSEEAALDLLQRNDLMVLAINLRTNRPTLLQSPLKFAKRISPQDVLIFTRQLATLFEARIPIIQSLKTLVSETSKPALREVTSKILDDISGGLTLSQSMAKHPRVFSSFYVSLVRSGEESGKLQEILTYLADSIERSYYFTSKARNAMIYPAFVLVAFVGVVLVMLVVVVPRLLDIFKDTGQALPFYTVFLIHFSVFLRSWGPALLVLSAMGGIALWRWGATPAGKIFFHQLQLNAPVIGNVYKKLYMARLTENLRTLIVSGIPIVRALVITKDVVGNVIYQKVVQNAIDSVKAGGTISSAFEKSPDVPPLVTQMMKIGETSGELDFILSKVAKFYEREIELNIENLVSLIEPLLIIVLGTGVAILIVSILLPLYNLIGSIG